MQIYEDVVNDTIFYHGTSQYLPFEKFDPRREGSGVVSSGAKKYGGFFFTSDKENAEYYGEFLVAKIRIRDFVVDNTSTHPPTLMKKAVQDHQIYVVEDVMDGGAYSNIAVVPMSELDKVEIVEWELTEGAEEFWIETLNEKFTETEYGWDEDAEEETDEEIEIPPSQESVRSLLRQTGGEYPLTFPPFKKWFDSLPEDREY